MMQQLRRTRVLLLLSGVLSCTSPNPNVRVRRLADGRLEVEAFFLSYLSDVAHSEANGKESCTMPLSLRDSIHPDAMILGGDHNHPHNRRFSRIDLRADSNWPPVRFVDPSTKRIWDRQLLLFYREKTGPCRSYSYDQSTRIVSALREGQWVPIGKVYNDQGDIEILKGMDWLP